ncbi:MAG: DNA-binding response regulator [Bacteroidetes bacterium CG18_big_fil_WC_8_21_14_2_50_41_14]|nr:MAG: DNA-binding response regulator [Bacteroidetes bacterium CG18_big_fil_WC_8_21_14_2_50_41_14]PJB55380.1 MAG: DNA-binding response regulator [Bacteroidetes bacterium CG_4_9_14_3_um_filter_41_19]
MPIKILIADDHQLFREGLMTLLSGALNIEIVAQAENGKQTIEKAKTLSPDIILMDIGMPIINGIEATGILQTEAPKTKVIALTMHSEKHFIKGMLEAGACGYLFKNCAYDELIDAINTVYAGKKYLSDDITEFIIHDYIGKPKNKQEDDPQLSAREMEILKLIADGKTSREISELLFVSIKTIGTHKQNILNKLNMNSTADLVKYAIKKGLISLW